MVVFGTIIKLGIVSSIPNPSKIPYIRFDAYQIDTYQNAYRGNFLPHIILIPIYFEHTYTVNLPNDDPLLPGTALTNAHFLS